MSKMVTRTVTGTSVIAKVINKNTDEISNQAIVLGKKFAPEEADKVSRMVAKALPTELALVTIISFSPVEKLYGVDNATFMAHAVELDPQTRKPLATSTPVTEEE